MIKARALCLTPCANGSDWTDCRPWHEPNSRLGLQAILPRPDRGRSGRVRSASPPYSLLFRGSRDFCHVGPVVSGASIALCEREVL